MDAGIVTRVATTEDAPALAQLNFAFNGVRVAPDVLAGRLADPQRVEQALVAEIDGRIAGFAALRVVPCVFYDHPHGELTELYVEEAYRQRGVGRALVLLAEQMAKAGGVTELFVLTGDSNTAARRLYTALRYTEGDVALSKTLLEDA